METVSGILDEFPHTRTIIWTGGEPMLQQREIVAAIDYLNARCSNRSLQHEVETNGTIDALPEFDARIHRYNCSPKTEMSGNDAYTVRLRNFSKTTYKYVVGTEKHCREALGEIDRQHLPRERCSFMVLGATSADMAEHGRVVAKVCMREGIRLCIRLQSILWESKRGT
jgi:organic radical activating enzyme